MRSFTIFACMLCLVSTLIKYLSSASVTGYPDHLKPCNRTCTFFGPGNSTGCSGNCRCMRPCNDINYSSKTGECWERNLKSKRGNRWPPCFRRKKK
uniref:Uncharacterized protein HLSG-g31 n=1 Tax=Haemaphysalis longicornis TaxID=44386 RepID=Q2L4T6_HAELO|nr:hypothetical protein [Haemaphysalis longicornis]